MLLCRWTLGGEAEVYLRRLANRLFEVWDCGFSDIVCWIHLRLAIALLYAVARGSHTKWRSLGVENSAAIRMYRINGRLVFNNLCALVYFCTAVVVCCFVLCFVFCAILCFYVFPL